MSEIKNAVIYARFSSDMQREESIEAQIRACTEYCRRKHYVVTNIYVDEAKSARDIIKRDAYNQMMESMLVGFAAYYSRNLAKETKNY